MGKKATVMRGSRGGTGGSDPLESRGGTEGLKSHKAIGFLSNTGPDRLENQQGYRASTQCWAITEPPAKRHLNSVSLAGPPCSGIRIISPLIN